MTNSTMQGDLLELGPKDVTDWYAKHVGEVYRIHWRDLYLVAQVDRIYETTRRETTAEVKISYENPRKGTDADRVFYQGRVNLLSQTARKKAATETYNTAWTMNVDFSPAQWAAVFEIACLNVLNARRIGIAPVSAAAMEQPEPSRWMVQPFIQDGQATILFGDGDTGKSMLATYWGVLTALGRVENGLNPTPGAVLFLDYETDAPTWWERVDAITAGMGVGLPDNFHYRPMMGHRLADEITSINKDVMDLDIKLVIIDSGAPACGEPLEVSDTVAYFNALRTLGSVATLTICHLPKAATLSTFPFGSVFWRNLSRSNFKAESKHDSDGSLLIGLSHTKSNNGPRATPSAFRVEFLERGKSIKVSKTDPNQIDELADRRPIGDRLFEALVTEPSTVSQLAEDLGLAKNTVSITLRRNPSRFVSMDGGKRWTAVGKQTA